MQQEEYESKIEAMQQLQDQNRELTKASLDLRNKIVDKEAEAANLRKSVSQIPVIEKKRDELQD